MDKLRFRGFGSRLPIAVLHFAVGLEPYLTEPNDISMDSLGFRI